MSAAQEEKNVTLMLSAKITDFSSFSSEDWCKDVMNKGTFILLGDGIVDDYKVSSYMSNAPSAKIMVGSDGGYIVENGSAKRVKFISGEVYGNEQ